ncbi:MAG TPA: hypothetical protein VHQ45_13085 [Gemmatimonadaceae bacterium]|nr:hypothetical protein [Gemmatimonadaceae bacterium]
MPLVPFDQLPPFARVWVFASTSPLDADASARLVAEVDRFLVQWQAHGRPLTCGRDWRHERFLTVAVDERDAGASGCSIDGLNRALRGLETALGTSLLGGSHVFYRARDREVHAVPRSEFRALAADGRIGLETPVFDLSVTTLDQWAERFEVPARLSWHARLISSAVGSPG